MYANREGKYLVPVRPSAGAGFWIGQSIEANEPPLNNMAGKAVVMRRVVLLWFQNPEYRGGNVSSVEGPFREFDNLEGAMSHLQSLGVTGLLSV